MSAIPKDSRYVPLTQQHACCVPTCIQMVMYRHEIPLIPAEEIGYHLGLTVHPDKAHLFYSARTLPEPPPSGYGTQIYLPEFEPNKVFQELGIPLRFDIKSISEIESVDALREQLKLVEAHDGDALLCFNHGALIGDETRNGGHVVVFDRMVDGQIRIVDPSPNNPKWRQVAVEDMFDAMLKHGVQKSAGVWLLNTL